MKIACVSIALNEAQFAKRWAESCTDADYRFVLDTGSTDDTTSILRAAGVHTNRATIRPWRFEDARNTALNLLPDDIDVVVNVDLDETLAPQWRHLIERCWTAATTRMQYGYVWSWTPERKPDLVFLSDKIAGRFTHRWRGPVHEVLVPTVPETVSICEDVIIEHHPDPTKSRGQYLSLLKQAIIEDPHDDRNAHYCGREYFFHGQYQPAIVELQRHLSLSKAVWPPERAASMRYIAKSYEALGQPAQAEEWYTRATLEDTSSREALIDLARFSLQHDAFHATLGYCQRALALPPRNGEYMAERYARTEGAHDLMAVAYWNIGDPEKAIDCAERAIALNPHDPRLRTNLVKMQELIEAAP